MNNLLVGLKRFISNKNTVTIIGVILGIAVLYFGYNARIKRELQLKKFPVAAVDIQPRTKITQEMVKTADMPYQRFKDIAYISTADIIGKYTNVNSLIPENGLFYKGGNTIVRGEELPESGITSVPSGMVAYKFSVTMESSYGNSMVPNNYIDIYFRGINDEGQIVFGKLVENVKILAVKDKDGKHVFENTSEDRVPSMLIFGVTEKIHTLMEATKLMKKYSAELIPVPINMDLETNPGEINVSSTEIEQFITSKTWFIDPNEVPEDVPPIEVQ